MAGSLPPTGQRSHRIINYALGSVTVQLPCPSASQHKSRSFVELIENRFCTQLRFRPLCTHVTYSPRFLSRLCRSSLCFLFFFLRFLSFPSLFSSPSYSDDIEIYDIKDLPRNNFVHVFLIREEVALSYGRNFNFRNELLHSVA